MPILPSEFTYPARFDPEVLASRIRQEDPGGAAELRQLLNPGVRLLAGRKLPAPQVEGCVDEVFGRVLRGVRNGALGRSAWLVEYVYAHLANHLREIRERRAPVGDACRAALPPATEDRRRIMRCILLKLSPGEQKALVRFYLEGREPRMDAAEFRDLRARVRTSFEETCRRD